LITLVGSGGVGKTRLAIESAWQLAPRFPDRVCLAELASTGSGRISAHDSWLVLDNCEPLIEDAARMTESLLSAVPNATVIATSREALRIAGEYIYRVPSLDVPPDGYSEDLQHYGAIQLLRERVGSEALCFSHSGLCVRARSAHLPPS
jgi:predicted ATPase